MRFLILIASILVVSLTSLLVLKASNPNAYTQLTLAFDFMGLGDNTPGERIRLEQIDLLPISSEKKRILTNRTIFLGASQAMVELALGIPRTTIPNEDARNAKWVYHFEKDMNLTALVFQEGKLVSAQTLPQQFMQNQTAAQTRSQERRKTARPAVP